MAKRASRGRRTTRGGGRKRRTARSSAIRRTGRGGRRQASMYGSHEGVSAPARDEVRQGERDFETA